MRKGLERRAPKGRVDHPPALCLCYSHRDMVRRIFREILFLALTALAVLAFSATMLVLSTLLGWWIAPSFVADWTYD